MSLSHKRGTKSVSGPASHVVPKYQSKHPQYLSLTVDQADGILLREFYKDGG